ncbi:hypothetical protein O181_097501, partial [Austropuccinia psidii MF-1]|nr:hypothetical protein [Austropuccinia psidii MF-1]
MHSSSDIFLISFGASFLNLTIAFSIQPHQIFFFTTANQLTYLALRRTDLRHGVPLALKLRIGYLVIWPHCRQSILSFCNFITHNMYMELCTCPRCRKHTIHDASGNIRHSLLVHRSTRTRHWAKSCSQSDETLTLEAST